jgi:sugar (pentulose or hexulose) kinase
MNVIAIFDIGKTNKKLFFFDEQYKIVEEKNCLLSETTDEEGEACEDLEQLNGWVKDCLMEMGEMHRSGKMTVRAVNFSAYGASLVHLGSGDGEVDIARNGAGEGEAREGTGGAAADRPIAPLYNYLKPYPPGLKEKFYAKYGGEVTFSMVTASPVLGNLNSGMQLYRIKEQRPELFERIKYSLHLPQYLSWLLTGEAVSDITSIGCHTNLWNFSQQHYHEWVYREGVIDKLAPLSPSDKIFPVKMAAYLGMPEDLLKGSIAGVGLHDSSAAMIPYLESFREPFVLISTGTWCISMNPFNDAPLTVEELQKDCLCYISYQGRPVKSARLFAGYEHEQRTRWLAEHFHTAPDHYRTVGFDAEIVRRLGSPEAPGELTGFDSYEEAYHRCIMDIMEQQVASTRLVLEDTDTKRIFVDGGFGKNPVYMHLLAAAFPDIEVFAASIPQASAMGAALAIHQHWNKGPLPGDIIELKYYR